MKDHSCCHTNDNKGHGFAFDPILHGSTIVIVASLVLYFAGLDLPHFHHFAHTILELFGEMWWGILLGFFFVGIMSKIPREYFAAVLGRGDTPGGIVRAAVAGIFLDLCCHGILMVAAKLYERGASLAQVMTFLIASPWNSLSLTVILVSLIGLKWTLIYVAASAVIAIVSGFIFMALVKGGRLPENPNETETPENFNLLADAKQRLKNFKPSGQFFADIAHDGWHEGKNILKWLLFGVILASAIRAFVPPDIFADWFGPTLAGLFLTLLVTSVIEVCSEGSAPVASELVTQADAPGNGFVFLMAGVATDYTEILVVREFTKSWKIALFLPLVTVPQVLVLGYLFNIL